VGVGAGVGLGAGVGSGAFGAGIWASGGAAADEEISGVGAVAATCSGASLLRSFRKMNNPACAAITKIAKNRRPRRRLFSGPIATPVYHNQVQGAYVLAVEVIEKRATRV